MGAYQLHKQPGWKLVHKHKTTQFERVGERYTKYKKNHLDMDMDFKPFCLNVHIFMEPGIEVFPSNISFENRQILKRLCFLQ